MEKWRSSLHILKQSSFTDQMLTDCTNDALSQSIFPDSLKFANITLVHKKDEATDNQNYRSVSVLAFLSKAFEKLIFNQLSQYLDKYLKAYYAVFGKLFLTTWPIQTISSAAI